MTDPDTREHDHGDHALEMAEELYRQILSFGSSASADLDSHAWDTYASVRAKSIRLRDYLRDHPPTQLPPDARAKIYDLTPKHPPEASIPLEPPSVYDVPWDDPDDEDIARRVAL